MYLKSINFHNFRGVKDLNISLHKKLNIFVGVNGVGKTTVLDGCSIVLSDIKSRILGKKNQRKLQETDINVNYKECSIGSNIYYSDEFEGDIKFHKKRDSNQINDNVEIFESLSKSIRNELSENICNIPSFIYYRTHRAVLDIPLKIRRKHDFNILETYDGSLDGDANFRLFFEWFRNEEDLENENKVIAHDLSDENFQEKINQAEKSLSILEHIWKTIDELNSSFNENFSKKEIDENNKELQLLRTEIYELKNDINEVKGYKESLVYKKLFFVRKALKEFLPYIEDLHIQRNPLAMVAKKNKNKLRLEQFSQGEKIYIAMIGDLARRLTIANPSLHNPLEGKGIVLIDEVELHLHPKWQSEVVRKLGEIFPNCQFIVTTHSPQVIREVQQDSVFLLSVDHDGTISVSNPKRTIGLSSSDILTEVMDSSIIHQGFQQSLDAVYRYIEKEQYCEAKMRLERMEKEFSLVPEIIKARSFLEFMGEM